MPRTNLLLIASDAVCNPATSGVPPVSSVDSVRENCATWNFNSVAEFYEDEVNLKLGAMVALIEPIMLIFMGILVAFILISLYLPIFSLSSSSMTR